MLSAVFFLQDIMECRTQQTGYCENKDLEELCVENPAICTVLKPSSLESVLHPRSSGLDVLCTVTFRTVPSRLRYYKYRRPQILTSKAGLLPV